MTCLLRCLWCRYRLQWRSGSCGDEWKTVSFLPNAQLFTSRRSRPSRPRHCTEHRLYSTHNEIQVKEISHSLIHSLTYSLPSLATICLCKIYTHSAVHVLLYVMQVLYHNSYNTSEIIHVPVYCVLHTLWLYIIVLVFFVLCTEGGL